MDLNLQKPFSLIIFVALFSGLSPKLLTASVPNAEGFTPALATWYGDPTGAGSGGACGWADDVKLPPFSGMIAAGNAKIFLSGKGCGDCYQIFCTRQPFCSGKPVTVTVTDECPGQCNAVPYHFDLSGTAFGAMGHPSHAASLRNLGQVDVRFKRVPCHYGRTKIAFKIDPKTSQFWFSTAIEYLNGDGGLSSVAIASGGTQRFTPMQNIWGAIWKADINPSMKGPFSFKLTSATGRTIVAKNVVPVGFTPGKTYRSNVNF